MRPAHMVLVLELAHPSVGEMFAREPDSTLAQRGRMLAAMGADVLIAASYVKRGEKHVRSIGVRLDQLRDGLYGGHDFIYQAVGRVEVMFAALGSDQVVSVTKAYGNLAVASDEHRIAPEGRA